MKKIRPAIFAMLLLIMVMSVTACGSNNSNTQSSTGASQNSSSHIHQYLIPGNNRDGDIFHGNGRGRHH